MTKFKHAIRMASKSFVSLTLNVNFLGTTRCEICSIRSYTDGTYNIFRSPQTLQYDELLLYVVLAAAIWLRIMVMVVRLFTTRYGQRAQMSEMD